VPVSHSFSADRIVTVLSRVALMLQLRLSVVCLYGMYCG